MTKTFTLVQADAPNLVFGSAVEALEGATSFDAATEDSYQYEIRAVFDNNRAVTGYQARVMDLDGFGAGYVAPVEQIVYDIDANAYVVRFETAFLIKNEAINYPYSEKTFFETEQDAIKAKYTPAADVEPANTRVRIGNPASAHLYNVGVNISGGISYIEVDANNRAQARKVAEENGYEVRDINMIG